MELYLLRHGLAGRHGDPQYKDDSLRPLTEEGEKKLRKAVRGMLAMELNFEAVFSSPYLRARQTAEIVAEGCGAKVSAIHLTQCLLPPASAGQLLQEIEKTCPHAESVVCAGHEPHMTQLISELLGSGRHLPIDFKKGGLACLSVEGRPENPRATLQWIVTPKQLAAMGKS